MAHKKSNQLFAILKPTPFRNCINKKAFTRGRTGHFSTDSCLLQRRIPCHAVLKLAQCRYRLHFSVLCAVTGFPNFTFIFQSIDCFHSLKNIFMTLAIFKLCLNIVPRSSVPSMLVRGHLFQKLLSENMQTVTYTHIGWSALCGPLKGSVKVRQLDIDGRAHTPPRHVLPVSRSGSGSVIRIATTRSLAHCQPSLKISCISVQKFLCKVANKQANRQMITSSLER